MSCFWTDFANCTDPSCFATTTLYALPAVYGHSGSFSPLFSDAALTSAVAPTTATLTHAKVYTKTVVGDSACDYCGWATRNVSCSGISDYASAWGTDSNGDPSVYPPTSNALVYTKSVDSDESTTLVLTDYVDALFDTIYPSGSYYRVGYLTIATDVGVATLVIGDSACF